MVEQKKGSRVKKQRVKLVASEFILKGVVSDDERYPLVTGALTRDLFMFRSKACPEGSARRVPRNNRRDFLLTGATNSNI